MSNHNTMKNVSAKQTLQRVMLLKHFALSALAVSRPDLSLRRPAVGGRGLFWPSMADLAVVAS